MNTSTGLFINNISIVVIGREAASGTRGAFEELLEVKNKCAYAQELDSTALDAVSSGQSSSADNKLKWSDVYKEALVPVYGSDGTITVYLTQGAGGVYNNGKTAAMYQSTDKGTTFKYIGQYEINKNN